MQIFHSWEQVRRAGIRPCVLSVGTFDGVHLGHQKLLVQLVKRAKEKGLPAVLITFPAPPRHTLDQPQPVLYTQQEKINAFMALGLDAVFFCPFDTRFAQTTPQAYLQDYIWEYFRPTYMLVGEDHRFGCNQSGDISTLRTFAEQTGFTVDRIEDAYVGAQKVSSSRIRQALLHGDIQTVHLLLAQTYPCSGVVIKGNQKGRTIGFPTSNIAFDDPHKLLPPNGVYTSTVFIEGESKVYFGMTNIGLRPTMNASDAPVVETNIFHFDKMIYGHRICIRLHSFLRKERKFANVNALIQQLEEDKIRSLLYFGLQHNDLNP